MSKIKLGHNIEGEAERDAIHVAVAPVTAEESLSPGSHVGFYPHGTVGTKVPKLIGIVDPFRVERVNTGERFWMFLYPETVANLRHDWSHPDFSLKPEVDSRKWLGDYATSHGQTYELLMAGVAEFLAPENNEHATLEDNFADWETPFEFWEHYKAVTGIVGQGSFWGCCI